MHCQTSQTTRHNHGLALILIVVLIWVASSFVVQDILTSNGSAFFITYFANSLFVVNLPLYLCFGGFKCANSQVGWGDTLLPQAPSKSQTLFDKEIAIAALKVAPLWFIANFLYNFSLSLTSVTSNTILSAFSGAFTFCLAMSFGQEQYSHSKTSGILFSLAGAVLTTVGDTEPAPHAGNLSVHVKAPFDSINSVSPSSASESFSGSFVGDAVCLAAAFFYAAYTTSIMRYLPSARRSDVMKFFGFIGLFNLVFLTPVVFILDAIGLETLSGFSGKALALTAAKGLFDNVLSDALWAISMKWTSPTTATVGLALTIPFSIIASYFLNHALPSVAAVIGAIMMIMGFILTSISIEHVCQRKPDMVLDLNSS